MKDIEADPIDVWPIPHPRKSFVNVILQGVYVVVKDESDIKIWHGFIEGAVCDRLCSCACLIWIRTEYQGDTPYKGGKFNFEIKFSDDFPFKPPEVRI